MGGKGSAAPPPAPPFVGMILGAAGGVQTAKASRAAMDALHPPKPEEEAPAEQVRKLDETTRKLP